MNQIKLFITVTLAVALVLGAYDQYNKIRYKEYIAASHIMEGFTQSSVFRTYASEYVALTGKPPSSNKELELPEGKSFSGNALMSVEIVENGVITITYNEKSGVSNGIIKLIPDIKHDIIVQWKCVTPSYKKIEKIAPHCEYLP